MFSVKHRKNWPHTKGIYKIWFSNSSTGKVYVGSTFCKAGFNHRWAQHLLNLRKQKHPSKRFQHAFNKYGEDNLLFEVIVCISDFDELILTEQKYIDELNAYSYGYNSSPTAGSQCGYKHTDNTLQKIKDTKWKKFEALMPDIIRLYNDGKTTYEIGSTLGVNHNTVSKILKMTGVKLRLSSFYKKVSIFQYSKDGTFLKEHDSAYEAASELRLQESHIRRVLKSRQLFTGGFHFSYKTLTPEEFIKYIVDYKREHKSGYVPSEEHIKKMREAALKSENPFNRIQYIEQYNLDGMLLKIWNDSKDIVEFYNLKNIGPIIRVLRGKRKKFKNSLWKCQNYKPRVSKSKKEQTQIT